MATTYESSYYPLVPNDTNNDHTTPEYTTTIMDNQDYHQGLHPCYTMGNPHCPRDPNATSMGRTTNRHSAEERGTYDNHCTPLAATTMYGNCASGWGDYSHHNKGDGWGGAYPHNDRRIEGGTTYSMTTTLHGQTYVSTSLPYDTTTRYISRGYQTSVVHGTMKGGCTDTSTCTSNPMYGEAPSAAPTMDPCTPHRMYGEAVTTMPGNRAGQWGAYHYILHSDSNSTSDYQHTAAPTTMATNSASNPQQLQEEYWDMAPPTLHDTTTPTLRMNGDHLVRNYGRLQFDRGPSASAPTTATPPQAPTKTATMTVAAPMLAASSTPAVYGDHCVGEWGAYHYDVHGDSKKADDWDTNVIMMVIPCRDSSIAWDLPFSLYFNISNLKHYTFLCKYTKEQLTFSHYNSTQYTVTQLDSSSIIKRNTHSNTLN